MDFGEIALLYSKPPVTMEGKKFLPLDFKGA